MRAAWRIARSPPGVYTINGVPTSGLLLWLNAGAITGVNNGGVVSTWPDSSGLGNNATQTTSGIQPTYVTGDLNGQPAVRFASASSEYMNIASGFNGNQSTLTEVFVLKSANARALFQTIPARQTISVSTATRTPSTMRSTSLPMWIPVKSPTAASSPSPVIAMPITICCFRPTAMACNSTGRASATPIPSEISGSVLAANNHRSFFNGDVCEMLVYNHVLTSTDKQTVETYLAGKYGLTVNEEQPPTVSITAPANNAQYTAPATVSHHRDGYGQRRVDQRGGVLQRHLPARHHHQQPV